MNQSELLALDRELEKTEQACDKAWLALNERRLKAIKDELVQKTKEKLAIEKEMAGLLEEWDKLTKKD